MRAFFPYENFAPVSATWEGSGPEKWVDSFMRVSAVALLATANVGTLSKKVDSR